MSSRNHTNAVLGTIAIFSVCILLIIIAWHYMIDAEGENISVSETSGDEVVLDEEKSEAEFEAEFETDTQSGSDTESEEYEYSQIITEFVTEENSNENSITQKYILIDPLLQKPSLPTGCEITSLTAVLNYWGYDVDKETMADDYLEKGELGEVTAYEAFIGNPASNDGYGCFAPVIVRAANKYLAEQNSFYTAYDLTGTALEELYDEINQNHPVIVWVTIDMSEPKFYSEWLLDDGTYSWISGGHCVVLTGYNKETNYIYAMDPLKGNVMYDATLFNTRYEQMYSQAVVIK